MSAYLNRWTKCVKLMSIFKVNSVVCSWRCILAIESKLWRFFCFLSYFLPFFHNLINTPLIRVSGWMADTFFVWKTICFDGEWKQISFAFKKIRFLRRPEEKLNRWPTEYIALKCVCVCVCWTEMASEGSHCGPERFAVWPSWMIQVWHTQD